jgi:hypothetical protein
LKTLREASVELGIPESEIKVMVDLKKVRAVLKKGKLVFAPDELAKIKRLRKTLPESVIKTSTAEVLSQAPPTLPKKAPPPRRPPIR